jgi:hypothetical protein
MIRLAFSFALLSACASQTPSRPTTPNLPPERAEPAATKPAPVPAALSPEMDALGLDFTVLMEDISAAVKAHGPDCGKIADAVGPILVAKKDTLVTFFQKTMALSAAQQQALKAKYGARIDAASESSGEVEVRCKDDPKFKAMQERLNAEIGSPGQ